MESYHDHHKVVYGDLRLYHHNRHAKAVTGLPWKRVGEVISSSTHPHFCFAEVHAVLDLLSTQFEDIRLLTFGRDEFQRYKINLCDTLSTLDIHVVGEPKGDFLAREFADEPGILVDDKYPLALPDHWQHIWINREEQLLKPKKIKQNVWQISSLEQLPKLLASGIIDTK